MNPHLGSKRECKRGLAGFTLSELTIASVILVIVSAAIMGTLGSLRQLVSTGTVSSELQALGERTLTSIMDDMRMSGFVNEGGADYPYLFDNGVANAAFAAHDHAPHVQNVDAGDLAFGESREIVFLLPADVAPRDGRPDVDTGVLQWGMDEFSYVVVTGPDGVNYLQRRVNGGSPRNISHHVERIVFDDNTTAILDVPLQCVRVSIDFLKEDMDGLAYRHRVQATIRLRNGPGLL